MKIECPSCHLAGKINELELPPEGRNFNCPRCKNSFHVAKPPAADGNKRLVNSCPSCQYSTFTDEMFAVCPKCGLAADDYQEKSRKQRENEQLRHDQEVLNRSYRNSDLGNVPTEETVPGRARAAHTVEVTGWLCIYWRSASLLRNNRTGQSITARIGRRCFPSRCLSRCQSSPVFFSLGFIPWLITLFSSYFIWAASQFLKLRGGSRKRLTESAWAGFAVVVMYEIVDFIKWIRVSSTQCHCPIMPSAS